MLQHQAIVDAGTVTKMSQAVGGGLITHRKIGVNMPLFEVKRMVANRQAQGGNGLIQQRIQPQEAHIDQKTDHQDAV
ncbi:hypothetical protein D3C78_1621590 [compost metagenome]